MGAKQRIEAALSPLKIYSTDCPVLNGEIEAYAAAIDLVTAQCDNIRKEMFAVTAENDGLTRMERLLELEESEMTAEERRERILTLCALIPGQPYTEFFISELFKLLNEKYAIVYRAEKYQICFEHMADFTMEDLTAAADFAVKNGPAFMRFMTDMPMYTWAEIEALNMTFFDIREKGIPWGFFDETL